MVFCGGYEDLGFAKLDIARPKRRGFAEVVYSPGKTKLQLKEIVRCFLRHKQQVLLTKLEEKTYRWLKKTYPVLRYNKIARLGYSAFRKNRPLNKKILVICAGSADIPVAEEAAATLEVMGEPTLKLYDVGVAGVHRLMQNMRFLKNAKLIIVVAGMEGALASLVSGLVRCPVIAVPTSSGYGANFGGLSALLTMLNCCSPGVAVVNIDNGFGAGYLAARIIKNNGER